MTPARQPHPQRCEKIADRNDIIAFMKFAGFNVELAERTDGAEELTITGFDDTGDTYMLEFASITPTGGNHCDKCDHWDMCEGCPYTDERSASHSSRPVPEVSAVDRFNRAMISGQTISKEVDVGISFSAQELTKRDAAIRKAERERVLDAVLRDLAGRSCIGLALEKIEREHGKGWLRGELLKSLRGGEQE